MSNKQYLYKVSILNKKNSNPLEAISFFSGESQYDLLNSKLYKSNTTDSVIWNNIFTPQKDVNCEKYSNLPEYLKLKSNKKDILSNSRNILWQNVFSREKREDAQFARIFELIIPGFLSKDDAVDCIQKLSIELVNEGMIVDASIHLRINNINFVFLSDNSKTLNKLESNKNYTGFLMCTLRDYKNGFFINKNRNWNDKFKLEKWRTIWIKILTEKVLANKKLDSFWEEKLKIYPEYENIKNNLITNF